MGVAKAGQAFVSLGTSGVLFAANDGYRPDPATAVHTFCHALPGTWHQMGVILAATDALNWFAGIAGADAAHLTADLGPLHAPGRTLFLPYLGGERTPLNSATVRGAFIGLEHATDRAAATRAVLEGVAFALRDCRDALAATGTRIDSLVAVGGGSRSDYWLQGHRHRARPSAVDPRGGRLRRGLRRGAAGHDGRDRRHRPRHAPRITRTVAPDPGLAAAFDDGHARYRRAAQAILELT
jgi:xylulokinase